MNQPDISDLQQIGELFQFHRVVLLLIGIGILVLLAKGITRIGDALYSKLPSRRLLVSQVATVLNFFVYILGGLFLFYAVLQPPRELMIAVTGSAAVALGLSLKDLVASVIAGFILLFDRPFQVGDRVSFGEVYGEVRSIGLRSVRLVTLDDNEVTIPNNRFMTDVVASGNAGALDMMVVADFHFSLDADVRKARDLLYEVVVTSRYVYLKRPAEVLISEEPVAERIVLRLRAKAYVMDVHFEKAFQTDIFLRATEAFKLHGIARVPMEFATAGAELHAVET